MTITKRETIVSVAIVALMLVFGFMIHGAINDSLMLKYQKYNTALQITEDADMFEYAMKTNIGNSFVYGNLVCVDSVTYPEIGGEYSYVEKVKERYTKHTRVVTYTVTVNGKPIALAPKEYELLIYLIENKDMVLSRNQILDQVWGTEYEGYDRAVDTHIKKLRAALGNSGSHIETVIKAGYKWKSNS